MKKKFVMTVEATDDGFSVIGENDGFNVLELIGVLQDKILDLHNQLHEADLYKHTRVAKVGDHLVEITKQGE